MLRGFYTAASGILSQQRTLDVLTNNIANVRTPGFRASRVVTSSFEQELLTRMEGSNSAVIGSSAPMQVVSEVPVKFDTNSLQETGSPFDFALDGEGFFNIQAPEDEAGNPGAQYLTRNGSFTLNGDKQLELTGVGLVLGEKGVIELDDANFTVDTDGSVYDSRGRYVDRLLVTVPQRVPRPGSLETASMSPMICRPTRLYRNRPRSVRAGWNPPISMSTGNMPW